MAEALEPKEQLTFWLNKVIAGVAQLPLGKVRLALYLVLSVWIITSLVDLTWTLVSVPEMTPLKAAPSSAGAKKSSDASVDVTAMQGWNLFGAFNAANVQDQAPVEMQQPLVNDDEIENAAPTRLQLTLQGLVQTDNPELARAVISYQNKQSQYKIGDKIPGGSRVILARVLRDRAILDNSGRMESLMLYDEKALKKSAFVQRAPKPRPATKGRGKDKVVDHRENAALNELAASYKAQLLADPISLADVIRVSVAKDASGAVIGYKVRPGKHRKQFKDFGFVSNDVVTSINGIDLNSPTKALEVYRLLREAKDATFSVNRNGEDLTVIVGLGEE